MADDDFSIESLSIYLHLQPAQVTRLAERGKLPARKVSGQWRFSRAAIHHWMEERMGLLDEEQLAHFEGTLEQTTTADDESTSIATLFPKEAVAVPLEARTRSKVINAMVDLAARSGRLWDPKKMAEAVRAREEMQPTALDNGIALLHPRRPLPGILSQAVIALGCTPSGIPFGGGGGILTDVFFLIASADDRSHLRSLARISRIVSDPQVLQLLREARDAESAHAVIMTKDADIEHLRN